MKLTQDQQDLLDGKFREGAKLAMKVQVAIGESFGAERMVPITRAHVALSNQDADRWLAEKLAGLGAKCRVRPRRWNAQIGHIVHWVLNLAIIAHLIWIRMFLCLAKYVPSRNLVLHPM